MTKGFHLIELLIVLMIISLLTNITINSYTDYLVREKRLAAIQILYKAVLNMEQYYFEYQSYIDVDLVKLHLPEFIVHNQYRLVIIVASENSYQLSVIPQGAQADRDISCGKLSLDSQGKREISGRGKINDCWS